MLSTEGGWVWMDCTKGQSQSRTCALEGVMDLEEAAEARDIVWPFQMRGLEVWERTFDLGGIATVGLVLLAHIFGSCQLLA